MDKKGYIFVDETEDSHYPKMETASSLTLLPDSKEQLRKMNTAYRVLCHAGFVMVILPLAVMAFGYALIEKLAGFLAEWWQMLGDDRWNTTEGIPWLWDEDYL